MSQIISPKNIEGIGHPKSGLLIVEASPPALPKFNRRMSSITNRTATRIAIMFIHISFECFNLFFQSLENVLDFANSKKLKLKILQERPVDCVYRPGMSLFGC